MRVGLGNALGHFSVVIQTRHISRIENNSQ